MLKCACVTSSGWRARIAKKSKMFLKCFVRVQLNSSAANKSGVETGNRKKYTTHNTLAAAASETDEFPSKMSVIYSERARAER